MTTQVTATIPTRAAKLPPKAPLITPAADDPGADTKSNKGI